MMTKGQALELIEMFDGYGLVVTDDELLSERADELAAETSNKPEHDLQEMASLMADNYATEGIEPYDILWIVETAAREGVQTMVDNYFKEAEIDE